MKRDTVILFHPLPWQRDNKKARVPYSLLFLERNIRDLGLNIVLIDEFVQPEYERILRDYSERVLLTGVSTMTGFQLVGALRFSTLAAQILDAPMVWGGWHPTILPGQTLENELVDFVICGQGEEPLRNLILALLNDNSFLEIPGLGYRRGSDIVVNSMEKFKDPFSFPQVDFSRIDINKYIFKNWYSSRSIRYITTQGCPYQCGFCSLALVYGRKWYHKKVEDIIQELEYFKAAGNIDGVKFDDDNFFVNREFVLELCREMIRRKLNLKWFTQGHASHFLRHFKEEDFDLMRESGASMISIGAESGDQVVLDLIAKNNRVEDNIECSKLFARHGIRTFYTVMVCFPVDPARDFAATLNLLMDAKLIDPGFRALLSFFTPYPGTDLYPLALQKGYRPPESLSEWSEHTFKHVRMPWVDKRLYYQAWRFIDFYLPLANPRIYRHSRLHLRPLVWMLSLVFYPLVRWRFRHKNLRFPLEANLTLYTIRFINRVLGTRLKLRMSKEGFFE